MKNNTPKNWDEKIEQEAAKLGTGGCEGCPLCRSEAIASQSAELADLFNQFNFTFSPQQVGIMRDSLIEARRYIDAVIQLLPE